MSMAPAIAHAKELEAGRRYRVPPRTCTSGEEQLAALFEPLAGIEDKHANEIDAPPSP